MSLGGHVFWSLSLRHHYVTGRSCVLKLIIDASLWHQETMYSEAELMHHFVIERSCVLKLIIDASLWHQETMYSEAELMHHFVIGRSCVLKLIIDISLWHQETMCSDDDHWCIIVAQGGCVFWGYENFLCFLLWPFQIPKSLMFQLLCLLFENGMYLPFLRINFDFVPAKM